jgi:DNA-binding CsgD family transcriptional regulator/PAS domain-containing protein
MNPREPQSRDLLGLLYEAAHDDGAWQLFLREVASAAGGESAALVMHNVRSDLHLVSRQWGLDPEGIRLYSEYYGKVDVWAAKFRCVSATEWLGASETLCSFHELERTEYFNDFLLRFQIAHGLFGVAQNLGGAVVNLSVYRSQGTGPFEEREVELMMFLAPHVKRALRLHFEFAELKACNAGLQIALDSSGTAILLIDRESRVMAMNKAARHVLGQNDGLLVRHAHLHAERSGESALLANLLSQAATTTQKNELGCAGGMLVSRKGQRPPLQVLVAPAGKLHIALEHPVTALVFVTDPEQRVRPPQEVLHSLFGLTPAECRVALLLTDGHTVPTIADMIGVKRSTLKSQLSSIYLKTSTSRQSELLRLLLRISVPVACERKEGIAQFA